MVMSQSIPGDGNKCAFILSLVGKSQENKDDLSLFGLQFADVTVITDEVRPIEFLLR